MADPPMPSVEEEKIGLLSSEDKDLTVTSVISDEADLTLDEIALDEKTLDRVPLEIHPRSATFTTILAYASIALHFIKSCLLFLLPSFISCRLNGSTHSQQDAAPLRQTAFLDGLRGLAAWAVFNAHLSSVLCKDAGASFGAEGKGFQIYKLPFLKLIYKGDFSVSLFFVISGWALSVGPVAAMRKTPRDAGGAMRKLAGTIFRRPIRLFGPSWASMFITLFLVQTGIVRSLVTRRHELIKIVNGWTTANTWAMFPPRTHSFFEQFKHLFYAAGRELWMLTSFSSPAIEPTFNRVLWTIRLEFRSSLILYLTHTALFFVHKRLRVTITLFLIVLGASVSAFDPPLFWIGYLYAEFFTSETIGEASTKHFSLRSIAWWFLLFSGCFLASYPNWRPDLTAGWVWLHNIVPVHRIPCGRFYTGVAAAMFVLAVPRLSVVRKFYESRLVQYLGKISFSLYLVHHPMVHTLGIYTFYNVWSFTSKDGVVYSCIGFFIGYFLTLAAVVWAADVFWRAVDEPCQALAAKFEKWAMSEY